jgi:hypothetical protein
MSATCQDKYDLLWYNEIKLKVNLAAKGKSRRGASWARLLNYWHLKLGPSFWWWL